jgi:hypothetical protein
MESPEMSAVNKRLDTRPTLNNIGSGFTGIIHQGRA